MKNLKLLCCASLLATGIAQASSPCDGFEIKIKNQLADDLLISKIQLSNAQISPDGIQKIDGKTEQVFTVNKSAEDALMVGEFSLHTISIPTKAVQIKFDLKNTNLICEHTDQTPEDGAYAVEKTRLPGKVLYTIINK